MLKDKSENEPDSKHQPLGCLSLPFAFFRLMRPNFAENTEDDLCKDPFFSAIGTAVGEPYRIDQEISIHAPAKKFSEGELQRFIAGTKNQCLADLGPIFSAAISDEGWKIYLAWLKKDNFVYISAHSKDDEGGLIRYDLSILDVRLISRKCGFKIHEIELTPNATTGNLKFNYCSGFVKFKILISEKSGT